MGTPPAALKDLKPRRQAVATVLTLPPLVAQHAESAESEDGSRAAGPRELQSTIPCQGRPLEEESGVLPLSPCIQRLSGSRSPVMDNECLPGLRLGWRASRFSVC